MASSGSDADYTTDDEEYYEYEDEDGDGEDDDDDEEEEEEEEDSEDYDDSDEYDEDDDEESEEDSLDEYDAEDDEDECENGVADVGISRGMLATENKQQKQEEISQSTGGPFSVDSVSIVIVPDRVSDDVACGVSKDMGSTADSLVVGEADCEAPDPDVEKEESLPLPPTAALPSNLNKVKVVDTPSTTPRCNDPPPYIQLAEKSDSNDTDLK
eukprot:c23210_g1_i1 orf=644-1282(-)